MVVFAQNGVFTQNVGLAKGDTRAVVQVQSDQACVVVPDIPRWWFFRAPHGRHFRHFRHFPPGIGVNGPVYRARECARLRVRVGWGTRVMGYGVTVRTLVGARVRGPGPGLHCVTTVSPLFPHCGCTGTTVSPTVAVPEPPYPHCTATVTHCCTATVSPLWCPRSPRWWCPWSPRWCPWSPRWWWSERPPWCQSWA